MSAAFPMRRSRILEPFLVFAAAVVLAVVMTYPLAFRLGSIGRIDSGDGQWSIWVVAWVAHALLTDPLHVFDANSSAPVRGLMAGE